MTSPSALVRKKLIEVSIPLEAINAASKKQKAPKGYPTSLHTYWAPRPLAACRAVLFAQLVDDPSSWPERFAGEVAQEAERKRLHAIIADLVKWENSNNEIVLNAARWEIARSIAWGVGEDPPPRDDGAAILAYLQTKAPPVYDPFCGGGSIPLEAQRLGLRAYGSDLNPVAVLISKALVEIPPKFAGRRPVHPGYDAHKRYRGAQGLAEDVRFYGQWMSDEAERRIGQLYPKARLLDGSEATVIAWLWARTVRSPDPRAKGAMVPLVSSFLLSTKEGKKAWVEPTIDPGAPDGWRFEVGNGALAKVDEKRLSGGTKAARATFNCVLTGANISGTYIDGEAEAGRMAARLMAVVAEGGRSRIYLSPAAVHEDAAAEAAKYVATHADEMDLPRQECRGTFASNAQGRRYCFQTFADYFTPRQLVALTTFADLVNEARERILATSRASSLPCDPKPLHEQGTGPIAYADAISTYLAFAVDRAANYGSSLSTWLPDDNAVRGTFGRQALQIAWDYCEANYFGKSSADIKTITKTISDVIECLQSEIQGVITQIDAPKNQYPVRPCIINADPPYYDNVAYADLSDFFYVWLRRSLKSQWPDLFRRLTTPKAEELVATAYRFHDDEAPEWLKKADRRPASCWPDMNPKQRAEVFFMHGMSEALIAMREAATDDEPLAVYYAFKQSEVADEGVVSPGWASFLQGVVDAGLCVDGTWPLRTESAGRLIGRGANALASSIVHVCRKRDAKAPVVTRSDFLRALKREMPLKVDKIRKAGVGAVDMEQSVIGPGMSIFTRFASVLEDDDSQMSVKSALALINRVWGEIENDLDANFDPETQVALAWFATYGFDARPSGELITLTTAKNTSDRMLFGSAVFKDMKGKVKLRDRSEWTTSSLPSDHEEEKRLKRNMDEHWPKTVWGCVQYTARVLRAEDGGAEAAAKLVATMGAKADNARLLAHRLYQIAHEKGWASEALVYNELAQDWTQLEDQAMWYQHAPPIRDLFGAVSP
jgi:putative DNA methylase